MIKTKIRNRYLDWLVTATCGPELLGMKLFPNAKEVTETMACFEATTKLPFAWNDEEVTAFVVGDGHKPRTGITFAMRTKWSVISIDPLLAPLKWDVKRFETIRAKIEDCRFWDVAKAVIVMPHSHAPVVACLEHIRAPERGLITLDCCITQVTYKAPSYEYEDDEVWSPHRLVRIWTQV